MISTKLYNSLLIDNSSGETRTTESILKKGDWAYLEINNYTQISPLVISSGTTGRITFQSENLNRIAGNIGSDIVVNYDFVNQKFIPNTLNDLFQLELRFRYQVTSNAGYVDFTIESPNFTNNPLMGKTISSRRANNEVQYETLQFNIFIDQYVVENGLELLIRPSNTDINLFDITYLIYRASSGK